MTGAIIPVCRWCCEAPSAGPDGLCTPCHDVRDRGEIVIDGWCPFMFCLVGQPHAHPVCPDCGAVRYGNAFCGTCKTLRGSELNPHRLLDGSQ